MAHPLDSRASTPLARGNSRAGPVTLKKRFQEPIKRENATLALQKIRQSPRLAVVSAFVALFGEDIGMGDFDIAKLEQDLSDTPIDAYTPWVTSQLLRALVTDKTISQDNYVPRLRREFIRRDPENSKLLGNDKIPEGEEGAPVSWHSLTIDNKLFILESICTWLLLDGDRFKRILKTEHDEIDWRIEPIGRDYARNRYWLFDDSRLWIQRSRKQPKMQEPNGKDPAKTVAKTVTKMPQNGQNAQIKGPNGHPPTKKAMNGKSTIKSNAKSDLSSLSGLSSDIDSSPDIQVEVFVEGDQSRSPNRKAKQKAKLKAKTAQSDSSLSDVESDDAPPPVKQAIISESDQESDVEQPPSFVEWETLCPHIDDFEAVLETFRTATDRHEKALYRILARAVPKLRIDWDEKMAEQIEVVTELPPLELKRSTRINYDEVAMERAASRSLRSRPAVNGALPPRRGNYASGTLYENLTEEEKKKRIEQDRANRQRERDQRRFGIDPNDVAEAHHTLESGSQSPRADSVDFAVEVEVSEGSDSNGEDAAAEGQKEEQFSDYEDPPEVEKPRRAAIPRKRKQKSKPNYDEDHEENSDEQYAPKTGRRPPTKRDSNFDSDRPKRQRQSTRKFQDAAQPSFPSRVSLRLRGAVETESVDLPFQEQQTESVSHDIEMATDVEQVAPEKGFTTNGIADIEAEAQADQSAQQTPRMLD